MTLRRYRVPLAEGSPLEAVGTWWDPVKDAFVCAIHAPGVPVRLEVYPELRDAIFDQRHVVWNDSLLRALLRDRGATRAGSRS